MIFLETLNIERGQIDPKRNRRVKKTQKLYAVGLEYLGFWRPLVVKSRKDTVVDGHWCQLTC